MLAAQQHVCQFDDGIQEARGFVDRRFELFQRTVRSFSHGCIRVYKPLDLAEVLLKDDPSWTRAQLDTEVTKGGQSIINLRTPIPVHLPYLTAWVNKDGTVHFRDDVYGRDKRVEKALKGDREQTLDVRI